MAYAEWHGSIIKHHKTVWLSEYLKVNRREAIGIRGALIGWAIDNRPGGYIEIELLKFACEWDGDLPALQKALLDAKLVDDCGDGRVFIHDWPEYTRGYRKVKKDAARIKRKRAVEARTKRDGSATVARQKPTVAGNRTEQNREEQNVQNRDERSDATAEATAPAAPDPVLAITERLVNLWNTGRTTGKLARVTPKRVSKVRARLKDGFEETDLVLVVKKLLESAWHQGQNENKWKAPGPEWVLASTEKVEEWISKEISNGGFNRTSGKAHSGSPSAFALKPGDLAGGAQTA